MQKHLLLITALLMLIACGDVYSNDRSPESTTAPESEPESEPSSTDPISTDKDGDGVENNKDEFPDDPIRAASVISAHRLLTQATFGATSDEIERIVKIGTHAWLTEQLDLPSAYDSASDNHKTHLERTIEIAAITEPNRIYFSKNNIFNVRAYFRVLRMQMSSWAENALGHQVNTQHGSDQLRQRMAYALSQI